MAERARVVAEESRKAQQAAAQELAGKARELTELQAILKANDVKREAEDSLRLRVAEKDQTIASMQQKIEELKQKAEQGSQQLQGEV